MAIMARVAYALGYTGMGVGESRFGANVMLDLLGGEPTDLTRLRLVRTQPTAWPPEPLRWVAPADLMTVAASFWPRRFPLLPAADDRLVVAAVRNRRLALLLALVLLPASAVFPAAADNGTAPARSTHGWASRTDHPEGLGALTPGAWLMSRTSRSKLTNRCRGSAGGSRSGDPRSRFPGANCFSWQRVPSP